MPAWPKRPTPNRRLPPARATRVQVEVVAPLAPQLVPRRPLEAWGALVIMLATFAFVVYLFAYTAARFVDAALPGRVAYAAIGAGAVAVLIMYGVGIVLHVLPAALGIRHR